MARRPRGAARAALVQAARDEFNEVGFEGTDSNRIARRAGYAPQTFYWHFPDKAAVFAEVFVEFVQAEYAIMRAAIPDGAHAVAAAVVHHHAQSRLFRRSLRALSVSDPVVRAARMQARRAQVEMLCAQVPALNPPRAVALLLSVDRLADAAAEGELAELGIDDPASLIVEFLKIFG